MSSRTCAPATSAVHFPICPTLPGAPALSFITVGEQYAGYKKQIARGLWNAGYLARLEMRLRSVGIVPSDIDICKTYGDLRTSLMQAQRTVAPNDLWIAACAVRHSLPLVTNNLKHFAVIPGLTIISEASRPAR